MHKETGELYLFTNITELLSVECIFWFLTDGDKYYTTWDDEDFIALGEL